MLNFSEIGIISSFPRRFEREYIDVLEYARSQGYTLPSSVQQEIENKRMFDFIFNGILSTLDLYYEFATDGDRNYALTNWKSPGTYQGIEHGSLTFTPLVGFIGDAATGYIDTQFAPSAGVNLQQNSVSAFCYENANLGQNSRQAFGSATTNNQTRSLRLNPRNGANNVSSNVNDSTTATYAMTDARGFWHLDRASSGTSVVNKGGVNVGSSAAVSSALSPNSIYLFAIHLDAGAAEFRASELRRFGAGGSLASKVSELNTICNV
jgi:hypothetical protein